MIWRPERGVCDAEPGSGSPVLCMELVLNAEGGSGLQRAVKTPGAPGDELAEHQ